MTGIPVLIVTGTVGVGKTTVAGAVSERLEALAVPHAFVDMDALRWCFPRPSDDRFHTRLGLRNLRAVWRNCRAAGATRLVTADVIETPADLAGYEQAVPGAEIVVARLVARPATIARRLHGRDTGSGLAWHLARAVELAEILERNGVGHLVVDTDEASPEELAGEILRRAGWTAE